MAKVGTGLLDGEKILSLYGGSRKKRVFLYLPSGTYSILLTNNDLCSLTSHTQLSFSGGGGGGRRESHHI